MHNIIVIKIIKILGKGKYGIVYLVEDIKTKIKYAMKIEQDTSELPLQLEKQFADYMSSKYPDQFMKIFKYKYKKCDIIDNPKKIQNKYCSIRLMSVVDDIFQNIIKNISNKQIILELLIQIINIAYLLNKEGYFHSDLKSNNIGVIYSNQKYIKILKNDIPTNGYLLQAIDFGNVKHEKFKMEEWVNNYLKRSNDMSHIIVIIFNIMMKNLFQKYPNIKYDISIRINKISTNFDISDNDVKVLAPYLNNFSIENIYKLDPELKKFLTNNKEELEYININYNNHQQLLYRIIFFDKFQDQLGIVDKVKLFKFISIKSIKYIFKNYFNIKKILKHLIKKLLTSKLQ
jgi:serine/threonine protein kinase